MTIDKRAVAVLIMGVFLYRFFGSRVDHFHGLVEFWVAVELMLRVVTKRI
jgi:hypothetical protein